MHALKNGFKVAFDIKEFWDGERFCEFKNLFLVCWNNIYATYYCVINNLLMNYILLISEQYLVLFSFFQFSVHSSECGFLLPW